MASNNQVVVQVQFQPAGGVAVNINQVTNALRGAASQASVLDQALRFTGFTGVLGVLRSGIGALADFMGDAVTEAQKLESAMIAVRAVAAFKGIGGGEITQFVRDLDLVRNGLLSVEVAATATRNSLLLGADLGQTQRLFKVAGDLAAFQRQQGKTYEEAFGNFFAGLRGNRPKLIDDLLPVTTKRLFENSGTGLKYADIYSKDRDKSAKAIDVLVKGVEEFGESATQGVGDAARSMETYTGRVTQASAALTRLKATLGTTVTESKAVAGAIGFVTNAINDLDRVAGGRGDGKFSPLGAFDAQNLIVTSALYKAKIGAAYGLNKLGIVSDVSYGRTIRENVQFEQSLRPKETSFLDSPLGLMMRRGVQAGFREASRSNVDRAATTFGDADFNKDLKAGIGDFITLSRQRNAALIKSRRETAEALAAEDDILKIRNRGAEAREDLTREFTVGGYLTTPKDFQERWTNANRRQIAEEGREREKQLLAASAQQRGLAAEASQSPLAGLYAATTTKIEAMRESLKGATAEARALTVQSAELQRKVSAIEAGRIFAGQTTALGGIDARIAALGRPGYLTEAPQLRTGRYGEATSEVLAQGSTQAPILNRDGEVIGYREVRPNAVSRTEAVRGRYGQITGFTEVFDESKVQAQRSIGSALADYGTTVERLTGEYAQQGRTPAEAAAAAQRTAAAEFYGRTSGYGRDDFSDAQLPQAQALYMQYRADEAKARDEGLTLARAANDKIDKIYKEMTEGNTGKVIGAFAKQHGDIPAAIEQATKEKTAQIEVTSQQPADTSRGILGQGLGRVEGTITIGGQEYDIFNP